MRWIEGIPLDPENLGPRVHDRTFRNQNSDVMFDVLCVHMYIYIYIHYGKYEEDDAAWTQEDPESGLVYYYYNKTGEYHHIWHQMTCLSIEQMMFRSTCNHTKTRMCS